MAAPSLINFPLASIVDGLLSYLQHLYSNLELTPSDYRWNPDDRKSKIRISAPFVVDNETPMSAPFIVVERGGFSYDDRVIDNLKSGPSIQSSDSTHVTINNGYINITFGSRVASEASSLANFTSMMIQADRHGIKNTLKFVRNLKHVDISPEIPVVKKAEVVRWEVTLRLLVSIQEGFVKSVSEVTRWRKASINSGKIVGDNPIFSESGSTEIGSDLLVDESKDFGPFVTNNPQILDNELSKGWYYVRFANNEFDQLYIVTEVVDNHTLKLATHDVNDVQVPWEALETESDISYDLLWNSLHLLTEISTA